MPPLAAVQDSTVQPQRKPLVPMSDRSVLDFPPTALLAATSLAGHPTVRWDQQRHRGDGEPHGGVPPHTPCTPGDSPVVLVPHLLPLSHVAERSAARIGGSPHRELLALRLWVS